MPKTAPVRRRDDWLIGQLPMGMVDDDFFVRFVSLFQNVATTLLDGADNITNVVDVTVAPPPVVRWLGSWIGASSIDASLPDELQRLLVRESSRALVWRGTRRGLEGFLTAVTGAPVDIEESGGVIRDIDSAVMSTVAPLVKVTVASTGWLSGAELVALIADEVPANVTLEVWLGDEPLHRGPVAPIARALTSPTPTPTPDPAAEGAAEGGPHLADEAVAAPVTGLPRENSVEPGAGTDPSRPEEPKR